MGFDLILGNQSPTVPLKIAPSTTILLGTSGICCALMDNPPNIQHYHLFLPMSTTSIHYLVKGVFAFSKCICHYAANVQGTYQYWQSMGSDFHATNFCHSHVHK
jgi:hypothetical protein